MIGVFDSGLGGLTVLKHFLKKLPKYDYIYLGDNKRAPYGNLSQEKILQYSQEGLDFLFARGANLVIFACNTASSQALRKIQQEYLPRKYPRKNVIGVIRPLAEYVLEKNFKSVGIIGTKATIKSKIYEQEILSINPKIKIFSQSAPRLVPLIEAGKANSRETKQALKKYLAPLKEKNIEALILACTHYPYLKKQIQEIMGNKTKIPCPGEIIANSLKNYLKKHADKLQIKASKTPKLKIHLTKNN